MIGWLGSSAKRATTSGRSPRSCRTGKHALRDPTDVFRNSGCSGLVVLILHSEIERKYRTHWATAKPACANSCFAFRAARTSQRKPGSQLSVLLPGLQSRLDLLSVHQGRIVTGTVTLCTRLPLVAKTVSPTVSVAALDEALSVSTEFPLVNVDALNDALTPGGNAEVERVAAAKPNDLACNSIVATPRAIQYAGLSTYTLKSGYGGAGTAQFLAACVECHQAELWSCPVIFCQPFKVTALLPGTWNAAVVRGSFQLLPDERRVPTNCHQSLPLT